MLSIDEAIAHARDVANEQKRRSGVCVQNDSECDKFSACIKCAEEHEQLAEWLEELSRRRVEELFRKKDDKSIRDKAIDDFQEWIKTQIVGLDNTTNEILIAVDDRWELATDKFKERVSND